MTTLALGAVIVLVTLVVLAVGVPVESLSTLVPAGEATP